MGGQGAPTGGPRPGQGTHMIQVTQQEMEAINRLVELGFHKQRAIQAYLSCDKNEELAANFLFEQSAMDDDDAYN